MGGIRRLSAEVAEVKRIYVQPDTRGANLGRLMLDRLPDDARPFGYTRACLGFGTVVARRCLTPELTSSLSKRARKGWGDWEGVSSSAGESTEKRLPPSYPTPPRRAGREPRIGERDMLHGDCVARISGTPPAGLIPRRAKS